MFNNKWLLSAFFLVLICIIVGIIYIFPVQKEAAETKFVEYIHTQGTSDKNIETKEMRKDLKNGGYSITVTYKDDPGLRYEYFYEPKDRVIKLIVFDEGKSIESGMKYPPL